MQEEIACFNASVLKTRQRCAGARRGRTVGSVSDGSIHPSIPSLSSQLLREMERGRAEGESWERERKYQTAPPSPLSLNINDAEHPVKDDHRSL